MAPLCIAGRAAVSAPSASCAQVSDTTTAAPWQASASPAHAVTPPAAGTRGSNPRTTAPAAHRPAAISEPASPSPSTATTSGSVLIAPPPGPGAPRSRSAGGRAWPARRRPDHGPSPPRRSRSEEHTSELQSRENLVCRLLLEKKKKNKDTIKLTKEKKN